MAVLGLHCYAQSFSNCSKQGIVPVFCVWASHCSNFSCCEAGILGCRLSSWAHRLSCPMACGIFLARNQIHVTFIGSQILNHWTTRKVPFCFNQLRTEWVLMLNCLGPQGFLEGLWLNVSPSALPTSPCPTTHSFKSACIIHVSVPLQRVYNI